MFSGRRQNSDTGTGAGERSVNAFISISEFSAFLVAPTPPLIVYSLLYLDMVLVHSVAQ